MGAAVTVDHDRSAGTAREPAVEASARRAWEGFRAGARHAPPNADPARFLAVCRALGDTPAILEAHDGSGVAGLLVGRRSVARQPFRLGYLRVPTPELRRLDVVYGGVLSRDEDTAWLSDLARSLRSDCDLVAFNHVPVDGAVWSALRSAGARPLRCEPHWMMDLAATFDETMAGHSSKHRANLRRLDRKLEAALPGVTLEIVTEPAQVETYARQSEEVAQTSYHAAIGAGPPAPGAWRALLGAEADAGRLRSYALIHDDRCVAYQAGAIHNGVYFAEGTAYRPECAHLRPGVVLLMRVVRDLCERRVNRIDFGFGDAEYKRLYGTASSEEATMLLFGRSLRARATAGVGRVVIGLTDRLDTSPTAQRMRRRVRRLWRRQAAAG